MNVTKSQAVESETGLVSRLMKLDMENLLVHWYVIEQETETLHYLWKAQEIRYEETLQLKTQQYIEAGKKITEAKQLSNIDCIEQKRKLINAENKYRRHKIKTQLHAKIYDIKNITP